MSHARPPAEPIPDKIDRVILVGLTPLLVGETKPLVADGAKKEVDRVIFLGLRPLLLVGERKKASTQQSCRHPPGSDEYRGRQVQIDNKHNNTIAAKASSRPAVGVRAARVSRRPGHCSPGHRSSPDALGKRL